MKRAISLKKSWGGYRRTTPHLFPLDLPTKTIKNGNYTVMRMGFFNSVENTRKASFPPPPEISDFLASNVGFISKTKKVEKMGNVGKNRQSLLLLNKNGPW